MNTHYYKGGMNTMQISIVREGLGNYLCLSKAVFSVKFSLPNTTVAYMTPLGGPSTTNTSIIVLGDNFMTAFPTHCLFIGMDQNTEFTAQATVRSKKRIECQAVLPPALRSSLGASAFAVYVASDVYNRTVAVPTGRTFHFYAQPHFTKISPTVGTVYGNTKMRIYGDTASLGLSVASWGNLRCLFASTTSSERHIISGQISSTGVFTCRTPPWSTAETVELRVSLNGQHYSGDENNSSNNNNLKFRYVQNSTISGAALGAIWVVLGVCVVTLVSTGSVWYRHRTSLDGYDRLEAVSVDLGMGEIEVGEAIGTGTFGRVYRGTWRGALVAVKKFSMEGLTEDAAMEFEKEVSIMKALRAPNILQFLGSTFNPPDICIVMEYMSRGSLHSILHNRSTVLEWPLLLRMLEDTTRGMTYLHSCRPPVIHRDLKSHNLLVDEFWRVKVSDFGLSTFFDQSAQDAMTACGTPCWTAPEVLRGEHYTVKADVYSFGVVMWECITRDEPYPDLSPFGVISEVAHNGLRLPVPGWVPQPYANLMESCWQESPNRRPPFSIILDIITEELYSYGWTGQPGEKRHCLRHVPVPLTHAGSFDK